jgi:hypothetical protein
MFAYKIKPEEPTMKNMSALNNTLGRLLVQQLSADTRNIALFSSKQKAPVRGLGVKASPSIPRLREGGKEVSFLNLLLNCFGGVVGVPHGGFVSRT